MGALTAMQNSTVIIGLARQPVKTIGSRQLAQRHGPEEARLSVSQTGSTNGRYLRI